MSVRREEPAETVATPGFDVREFARTAVGSHRDQLDLAAYDERPLTVETLRSLRYCRDLERATTRYLRHVLVTPTHKDARITAFLTTWAFEKYWIADAFDAILDHHGIDPRPTADRPSRPSLAESWSTTWRAALDRFAPIQRALVDNLIGESVIAGHIAIATIDGWLTSAAYGRIGQLDAHPELIRTTEVVRSVTARHLEFLVAESHDRLARSSLARRLTRSRLLLAWRPRSVTDEPADEVAFFFHRVFGSEPAIMESVDRRIQALPGLAGLRLIRTTVARAALRGRPSHP